jgi:hypothetical protein
MKASRITLIAIFLALPLSGIAGNAECYKQVRTDFKTKLLQCKEIQNKKEQKQCLKDAKLEAKQGKKACKV